MSESAKILLTLPSGEIRKYGLELETLRIGRAADNTVVIDDPSLSAHHCVMRRVGAGSNFSIEDLESTNGLEVNGESTTMAELSHADVVKIGEIMMLFMQAGRPPMAPLEPAVKKPIPASDEISGEDNGEPGETQDSEDEQANTTADDEAPPAPPKKKSPPAPNPAAQHHRQDRVQVEESGGCRNAIVSLLIIILAPVLGLCLHHYFATGRFLLLDLISKSAQ